MKEIKFRAWDVTNKKWAFKEFNLLGEVMLFDLLGQYKLEEHCELLVEQFTGSKDKNGKDIYEGDILEDEKDIPFFEKATQMTVEWSNECSGWFLLAGGKDVKVVGNIHENLEMVENE